VPELSTLSSRETSNTVLFNHGISAINNLCLQQPTRLTNTLLLSVYQQRVDSIFKVAHWPSLIALINQDSTEIKNIPGKLALESAIYFTASCTLSNEEAEDMQHCMKEPLLEQYQFVAEDAISRANLLQDPDLTVLQAFVIYLVCRP
jgi:hypothetical protein